MHFPMTPSGHKALKEELENFKGRIRVEVVKDLAEARAHGDLSENAEYDAAKERQAMVEARIRDLEGKLAHAQVIDPSALGGDKVVFGATVTIYDCDTDKNETWTLVGEDEADLKLAKLSVRSPLARAMIGKNVGDTMEVMTPRRVRECEIVKICFA